jgi:hypothetical protein
MTIELAGEGQRLTLALNLSDTAVELPGTYGPLGVAAFGWALG